MTFDDIAAAQGWDDASKIEILRRYIESQDDVTL
jgi:hypothetical protein